MSAIIETERMNLSLKNKINFNHQDKILLWIIFSTKSDQALLFSLIYEGFYRIVEEKFAMIYVTKGLPTLG